MKKGIYVRMLKTKQPDLIPNGTFGRVLSSASIEENGLHLVDFNGYKIPVYKHEVELIKTKDRNEKNIL
jgi:hypothetical protein